jgi:hypothetical protein
MQHGKLRTSTVFRVSILKYSYRADIIGMSLLTLVFHTMSSAFFYSDVSSALSSRLHLSNPSGEITLFAVSCD